MTRPYCIESRQEKRKQLGLHCPDVFDRALAALLTARNISIHQMTHLMPGEGNADANRQQIRRCLDQDTRDESVWTKAIAALLPKQPWALAMDRTEWKRGQTTLNRRVLAVVGQFRRETSCVHGCAVPLLWTVMPDGGASAPPRAHPQSARHCCRRSISGGQSAYSRGGYASYKHCLPH